MVGQPYWYGTCAYQCTQSLLSRKAQQYPTHYENNRMARYKDDIAKGKVASDCIGLIKGYMWTNEETGKQGYGANGCPDKGANSMHAYAKVKGAIDTLPEIPGLVLYKSGHVGVYIGDGWLVEAKGFAYGVVKSKVSDRKFTHWFQQPGLVYETDVVIPPPREYSLGERTLREDTEGADVKQLQEKLKALGYNPGTADGKYGDNTVAAVKAFQEAKGLEADGVYGQKTHAELMKAKPDDSTPPPPKPVTPTDPNKRYVTVVPSTLNVRSGPGKSFRLVKRVNQGDQLEVTEVLPFGWVPVKVDGELCFVSQEFVK